MMTARVLFTLASCVYVVSAIVPETTQKYFCQGGSQVLKLENASRAVECEQSWTAESIPIGSFIAGSVECHSPCINVTAGEIIISRCVNATLTVICNQVHVTEFRKHYQGIQNNLLPIQNFKERGRHHYGICACVILLLFIFVGFSSQRCISQHCRIRNTGANQL